MKLLVAFLAFFCVWALTVPRPLGPAIAENGTISEAYHHLTPERGVDKQDTNFPELPPTPKQDLIANRDNITADLPEKPIFDAVDDYNNAHPYNRIPTMAVCYHPGSPAGSQTMHRGSDILEALQEGHRLRQTMPYLDRPRFAGTHYPHQFQWVDMYQQTEYRVRRLDVGQVTGDMHMFPLLLGGNIFITGQHPFWDRVMFDDEGNYLGTMTWRGGWWWWCIPVNFFDDAENGLGPDRGATAEGVAGADEYQLKMKFPGGGWIDAFNPFGGGSHIH